MDCGYLGGGGAQRDVEQRGYDVFLAFTVIEKLLVVASVERCPTVGAKAHFRQGWKVGLVTWLLDENGYSYLDQ